MERSGRARVCHPVHVVQALPVSEDAHGPIADHRNSRPETTMKISARNQLKGKIVAVKAGATTSHVSIDIGQGTIITASITNEAVADLIPFPYQIDLAM